MSVRKERRTTSDGNVREFFIVDVKVKRLDGSIQRVKRVPTIQTKRAAEQLERELRNELLFGPRTPAPTAPEPRRAETFEEWSTTFVETYARTNNKASELETKRSIMREHLVPAFGALALDAINVEAIERFKAAKIATHRAKTINNHLTVLRKCLAVAVEWKRLDAVPTIAWLKVAKPKVRFLESEESDRLVECAAPEWRTVIFVALRTGLRLGELLALEWGDVDLKTGRIVVRRATARGVVGLPKSGREREVPLSLETVNALAAHRHLRSALVFCHPSGRPWRRAETRRPLWTAGNRARLGQLGWHVLRHTFASQLAMAGAPLKAIQELLGHSTIEMTMRYAHLTPGVRRDVVAMLDKGHPGATRAHEIG